MPDETILAYAADIVSAHVSRNEVATDQLPTLINNVHRALTAAAEGGEAQPAPAATPIVPIKRSVTASHISCLECGKQFSMLKRHLNTDHRMTPQQYRLKWDLPSSYPMVAPNYAKARSDLAKKIGL